MAKNIAYYEQRITGLIGKRDKLLTQIGELLNDASDTLSNTDYKELIQHLRKQMLESDLKAARAIAAGMLNPQLFASSDVAASKLVNLSAHQQELLLSGEKLDILVEDEDHPGENITVQKTYLDMTADEKNRLLGPKGGRVHAAHEQVPPSKGNGGTTRKTTYTNVTLVDHGRFEMDYAKQAGAFGALDFFRVLARKGQLDEVLEIAEKAAAEQS